MNKVLPFLVLLLAVIGLLAYLAYDAYRDQKGPDLPVDPPVARLVTQLQSWNGKDRLVAIERLGELGPAAHQAAPHLVHALKTGDEDVRINSTLALGQMGKPAVPQLLEAMKNGNAEVRFYAAWAVGLIGPEAAESAGAAVLHALEDRDDDVRRKAAESLGRMAPGVEGAVPALAKALKDESADVQQAAVDALGQYGPGGAKELLAALALQAEVRQRVVQTLGKMHDQAGEVAPALVVLLTRPGNDDLQWIVSQALTGLGRGAVPALVEGLAGPDPAARAKCLQALTQFGSEGVTPLADALKSPHADVRRFAAQNLGGLGVSDKLIPLALAAALEDPDRQVRIQAAYSLRNLGPEARPAIPALEKAAASDDRELKAAASAALQVIRIQSSRSPGRLQPGQG